MSLCCFVTFCYFCAPFIFQNISTPIITAKLVQDDSKTSARVVKAKIEKTTLGQVVLHYLISTVLCIVLRIITWLMYSQKDHGVLCAVLGVYDSIVLLL